MGRMRGKELSRMFYALQNFCSCPCHSITYQMSLHVHGTKLHSTRSNAYPNIAKRKDANTTYTLIPTASSK